jgi:ribose transport system permease protein
MSGWAASRGHVPPPRAGQRGIAYVPRERRREGLMLGRGIAPNVVLPHLARLSRLGGMWSRAGAERAEAEARGREVRLKYDRLGRAWRRFRGGTSRRWFSPEPSAGTPRLALLDEPTRGVDVGARADIYGMIRRLSSAGTSVVMASSDLPELLGMCDRIVILSGGGRRGSWRPQGLSPAQLLSMIYGDRAVEAWHEYRFAVEALRHAHRLRADGDLLRGEPARNLSDRPQPSERVAADFDAGGGCLHDDGGHVDGRFRPVGGGTMASLAGVVAATLFVAGWPVPWAIAAALAVASLGGLLNGFLVSILGILPFVATLGTMTVFGGLAFVVSDGRTIFGRDIPASFSGFARSGIELGDWRIPALTLVALAVLVVIWLVLEQTPYGRRLYAIGGNIEAARLAGTRVKRLRLLAFTFTGMGAAIAGLMYASRVASANPTQGDGLMLDAIACVFLGMTMSEEGEPRVLGTLLGVLLLGLLDNGLTQMNVDSYIREVLVGTIIILAVASGSLGTLKSR